MAEFGYGAQIVNVTEDHRFVMDENALGEVLLREDIKDLPVVLVSVAGAYRGGKSFLLNFFLRYLNAPVSDREDGSWIFRGETLEGFSWRAGHKRDTTGILIWSQPFICDITPEKKVAVLLMDTQGTFDKTSTMANCTNVFALSTLVSSVQLYNIKNNIQEDFLQHLHLFTEYGRMIHDNGHGKAFQVLTFLVRDWQSPFEYAYGTQGGNEMLETCLTESGKNQELQTVRQHIRSCFERVSCFLMPHVGNKVLTDSNFKGELNKIDDDFKLYLTELVNSIFMARNLVPKMINGKEIKAKDLFTYFKNYMSIFSSGQMPPIGSIMKSHKMAEFGYGAQIVNVTEDHRFVMDEHALGEVLLREDIKDLPVVLVSVAGAYRGGKSFLLNFFLRYLNAPVSDREDGSWIFRGETLEGFSWRAGSTRDTTGILIWSQPFICDITPEKKVAVLLMDTQGAFDKTSTMANCTNVFALSTLVCSVQLYNIKNNIQEDFLQHLHLFTEYGRMIHDNGHGKAFQVLTFLVRDWQSPFEYAYGTQGGNEMLETCLTESGKNQELQTVRQHIRSCFERVSCFLMPHVGTKVPTDPNFKGELNKIDDDFKLYLTELVNSIFKAKNLVPKMINGKEIKAKDLFTYFKNYMSIFSSGQMPPIGSIMKVTAEGNLLSTIREIAEQYDDNMERECGKNTLCVPLVDVQVLHERYRQIAKEVYSSRRLMGSDKTIKSYRDKLLNDIESRAEKYFSVNDTKRHEIKKAAEAAYNDKIKEYHNEDEMICVHPADIDTIHGRAKTAALETYDSLVKRVTNKKNEERDILIAGFSIDTLKTQNNRSNNLLVTTVLLPMYSDHMRARVFPAGQPRPPPLFPSQMEAAHNAGLQIVLQNFREKRRCLANSYSSDEYRAMLLSKIEDSYNDFEIMNGNANGEAMLAAAEQYKEQIAKNWNFRIEHLHPQELKDKHEDAKTFALTPLRSQNISKKDIDAVDEMLMKRYAEFVEINISLNEEAIQSAYNLFISSLEDQRRAQWYWIFVIPIVINKLVDMLGGFFNFSKALAITEFYKNRKNGVLSGTDHFYEKLIRKIDEHDPWKLLKRGVRALLNFLREQYGINIPFTF